MRPRWLPRENIIPNPLPATSAAASIVVAFAEGFPLGEVVLFMCASQWEFCESPGTGKPRGRTRKIAHYFTPPAPIVKRPAKPSPALACTRGLLLDSLLSQIRVEGPHEIH